MFVYELIEPMYPHTPRLQPLARGRRPGGGGHGRPAATRGPGGAPRQPAEQPGELAVDDGDLAAPVLAGIGDARTVGRPVGSMGVVIVDPEKQRAP